MKICRVRNAMEKEKSNWRSKNRKQRNFLAVVKAAKKKRLRKWSMRVWKNGKEGENFVVAVCIFCFFCDWEFCKNVRWTHTESAENVRLSKRRLFCYSLNRKLLDGGIREDIHSDIKFHNCLHSCDIFFKDSRSLSLPLWITNTIITLLLCKFCEH